MRQVRHYWGSGGVHVNVNGRVRKGIALVEVEGRRRSSGSGYGSRCVVDDGMRILVVAAGCVASSGG